MGSVQYIGSVGAADFGPSVRRNRDVVEVFAVDLELLEGSELGLGFAHVALLLVLFLSALCEAALAQDAGDGSLGRLKGAEAFEAPCAKTGCLPALTDDGFLDGLGSLVGAALGRP